LLDVGENEIGDKGALALAEATRNLQSLVLLRLDSNPLLPASVQQLKQLLGDKRVSIEVEEVD